MPSYEVDGLFTVLSGAVGLSVLWPRVTVEPTSAAGASNRFSSIFKVTNTTFYTLEDVRIEATLWCAKIGLGSDTITDTQATRLNPQQHVKAVELPLARRQHRHGASPGTPEPGDVSPLSCRGVSSLYCAYMSKSRKGHYGKSPGSMRRGIFPRLLRSHGGVASQPHFHRRALKYSWIRRHKP